MIKGSKPLSLAEIRELLDEEKNKELISFIKKFVKLTPAKAKELRKELESLNIIGLREEEIVKIIDLLPEDAEDLRKITSSEISLKQDEIQKILEIVQKYRK